MEELTSWEKKQRLLRVSLKNKDQLKRWLQQTDRVWLVFNSIDLVDSLPFPDGIDDFIRVVACYREHRQTILSGRFEKQKDPILGQEINVPLMKGELLEVEELDHAIRALIRIILEKDPSWKLENSPCLT